ncbi:MAG: DNA-binding protein [Nitrososphaeria archaeon]|nr:DNA-binding protein [Nitrososphaeria archaeon]
MQISQLRDNMRRVQVVGKIVEKPEVREVTLRTGQKARVADLTLEDETGSIKLTLWDEQIDMVEVGDMVRIENGYVNSYKGEIRLNVGRFGKLEVIGKK